MNKEELLRLASLVGTDSEFATANFINAVDLYFVERLDEEISHLLFEVYAEDVFTPATDEDYKRMNDMDKNLTTRLHCSGIRHGLNVLRREARGLSARDDLEPLTKPEVST